MAQIPAGIQNLFDKYTSLHTFAEVSVWDELAKTEIDKLTTSVNGIDLVVQHRKQTLEQARQERLRKPALLRMFDKGTEEKKLLAEIEALEVENQHRRELIEEIQSKIDITPNNPDEQTALLKELNLEKKELQIKKREINEQMREIRTEARQQSARVSGTVRGALSGSQYRATARRKIRYQAETELSPHEDAKTETELEIIRLEKDLLWVERFS